MIIKQMNVNIKSSQTALLYRESEKGVGRGQGNGAEK